MNDLVSKHPDAAAMWHPTKNKDKKPEDYKANDEGKFWWYCPVCHDEWESRIRTRIKAGGRMCKTCKMKITKYGNGKGAVVKEDC